MQLEEMRTIFNQELRSRQSIKKYSGHFTNEDAKLADEAFEMVFENKSLPASLLFKILTGNQEE
jgi:hypothetical protein